MNSFSWSRLLCTERLAQRYKARQKPEEPPPDCLLPYPVRDEFERDHDRILFSTPFRRLGDKTQLFPLESIESIRTRLTHSYEVANLARSVGVQLALTYAEELPDGAERSIPAVLAAIGLVHDLGNPPFGHQGEESIRSWFRMNQNKLFCNPCPPKQAVQKDISRLTCQQISDFLHFEGNVQTLRLVTKLQVVGDDLGLNLTTGTLAALMKYVVASDNMDGGNDGSKKFGFFSSEQQVVEMVRGSVELTGIARHPLALVMEACDDIAYSVMDAEDAAKKGLVSFNDLMDCLEANHGSGSMDDPVTLYVCNYSKKERNRLYKQNLQPAELNDVAMQVFRTCAINALISAVLSAFESNYTQIMNGSFKSNLIDVSVGKALCSRLKNFNRDNAYKHRTVLEIELDGHNIIHRLMDYLWQGISQRECFNDVASRRKNPFAEYVYSKISRNYRRVFEKKIEYSYEHNNLPVRYRELQLLTDMISGMTDQYCIDLYKHLRPHQKKMRPVDGTFA